MMWARVTLRNSSGRAPVEARKIPDGVLVGAPGARVAEIGEPLDLGRYVGQAVELGRGQQAGAISVGSWSVFTDRH